MIIFAICIGAGLACQSAVNAKLRTYVLSPFTASMISFFVGAIAITILTFLSGYVFWEEWGNISGQPLWIFTGGFLGVFSLTMNVILFPILGGIQAAVLPIFGQIIMGTLLDQFGWVHTPLQPLTIVKSVGLLLVLIGVLFATDTFALKQTIGKSNIGWKLLGILAGMFGALQAPVNGRLGTVMDSPLLASQISFYVGLTTLFIVVLITKSPIKSVKNALQVGWKSSWIFIGGLLGAAYVFGAAMIAPIIGTGQLVILTVFGQLVGSVLIDKFGFFGAMKKEVTKGKIIGLFVILVGVIVIKLI